MKVHQLLFCGLLLATLTAAGCNVGANAAVADAPANSEGASNVARVKAGPVTRKKLVRTTIQPGRIEAYEETPLFSKVSGYVEEAAVDIGDHVKKDQMVVRIWAPELRDDLRQAEAALAQADAGVVQAKAAVVVAEAKVKSAEAMVKLAEAGVARTDADYAQAASEHERMQRLAREQSVTRKLEEESLQKLRASEAARLEAAAKVTSATALIAEANAQLEQARADLVAAEAKRAMSESQLARQQTMVGYLELKAPYDGVVTARNIDTGHYLAGTGVKPLLGVARTDRVRVFADIPEAEAPLITTGDSGDTAQVQIQSLAGESIAGKVTRSSWALDSTNRSLRIEIDLPNQDERLRPGMYASVQILLDERDSAIALPIAAVTTGSEPACFVVESGKLRKRPIKLGLRSGDEVEVREGLRDGETVVLTGVGSLQDSQAVQVLPAG